MENVIVYVIVAVIVIVNIVRTYQKEAQKNKERTLSQPPRPIVSSGPAPFSRPRPVEEAPITSEYNNPNLPKDSGYNFANEGQSSIQAYINSQPRDNYKNDRSPLKIEDSVEDSFDLKLKTPEDFKRAFVHTLIFERKY